MDDFVNTVSYDISEDIIEGITDTSDMDGMAIPLDLLDDLLHMVKYCYYFSVMSFI